MSELKYNFYKNVFKGNYNQSKIKGGSVAENTSTTLKTDSATKLDNNATKIDNQSDSINNTTSNTPTEVNQVVTDSNNSPAALETPSETPIASETQKSKVEFKFSLDENSSKNPKTNIDLMFFKSIFGF